MLGLGIVSIVSLVSKVLAVGRNACKLSTFIDSSVASATHPTKYHLALESVDPPNEVSVFSSLLLLVLLVALGLCLYHTALLVKWVRLHEACRNQMDAHPYWDS